MIKKLLNKFNLIYIVIFLLFIVNSAYVSYPDEFVNILGGVTIKGGMLPYVHFFDHHVPFAWYLASFFLLFSFKSFILFRLYFAIFTFLILFIIARWIKKKNKDLYLYFLGFFFIYPMLALYYWFHLYLADSLAILFFSAAFWILITQTFSKTKDSFKPLLVSSFFVFLMCFSSLTFMYLGAALYLWHVYLIGYKKIKKQLIFVSWCISPYLIYFIYLFATNSFKDFYFANFVYNTQLYISIPNYIRGEGFNPIKFAATLIYNFLQGYMPLLSKIKHLDLYLPTGVLSGLSSFVLFFLFFTKDWILGIIYFFVLSFSAPRSGLKTFDETDYQSGLFLTLGIASSFVVLYILRNLKKDGGMFEELKRLSRILILIFLIFTSVFLMSNYYGKFFLRITQQMPSIFDSSQTKDLISNLIEDRDYYWIGPYEPNEVYYAPYGKIPGKYPTLLPQFRESEFLKAEFIKQFETNKPKIIIYNNQASIFNTPSLEFGKFFIDWMSNKYTQLEDVKGIELLKNPSFFDLKSDLFLLNSDIKNLLKKLENGGYIKSTNLSKTDK